MSAHAFLLPDGAVDWLRNGERGRSSLEIFSHLTGLPVLQARDQRDWPPSDVADLIRCRRLLEAVPSFRARLIEMAQLGPRWAAIVGHLDELCALMDQEGPGMRPRTHRRMCELRVDERVTGGPR